MYVNAARVFATFSLLNCTPGVYDVVVENPNNSITRLNNGFEVVSGGAPQLVSNVQHQSSARLGTYMPVPMTVEFTNSGNIDLPLSNVIVPFDKTGLIFFA